VVWWSHSHSEANAYVAVSRVPFSIGSRFVWGWRRTFGGSDEDDGALGRALRPGRGERLRGVCARDAGGQTHRRGDSGTERHGLHCCSFNCERNESADRARWNLATWVSCWAFFSQSWVTPAGFYLSPRQWVPAPAGPVDPNSVSTFGFNFGNGPLELIDRHSVYI